MKRRFNFTPFLAVLFLGLGLGSFSTNLVYGTAGNINPSIINGCIGTTPSSTALNLGGRSVPPNTILRVIGSNEACASNETSLNWNAQGVPGASLNPLQIATLHWYE